MKLGMQPPSATLKNANRRRFSDEQIKFLEFMFEVESRPESQKKQELANDLGLEPRQVSIWFQNRRARSKSKEVERGYNKLKASHDALASSFESLKREHQLLLIQLQKLKNKYAKQHESNTCRLDQSGSKKDQLIESRCTDFESKEKPVQLLAGHICKEDTTSSNPESRNIDSSREETEILDLTEYKNNSTTASDWHSFESNCLLDESSCTSQWWEFFT